MDAIVIEKDWALCRLYRFPIKYAITAHHPGMKRNARIGYANLRKMQHLREPLGEVLVKINALFPRGGLILIALFVRCAQ